MVFSVLEEYNRKQASLRSESRRYKWDDLQYDYEEPAITMTIPNGPTEIEEGEIVEDVYPHDLLDPEPFIRAPVISYEAAVIMEEEFYQHHWEEQYQEPSTLWDIQDQERENYEEYLLEMAEQADMEYDDL
jgi:hypothetical protein